MTASSFNKTPGRRISILWIVAAVIGWFASFELLTEFIKTLRDPAYTPNCNINPLVTCGPNMGSWQGSIFGFSNTIIGVTLFVAPIIVGVSILAGQRITARWYWITYAAFILGAYVLITWLYSQSIFSLGTLCPWCMVVWTVTIPLFWYTSGWTLAAGHLGDALRPLGRLLWSWAWVIVVLNYLLIAVLAQVRLDWLSLLV